MTYSNRNNNNNNNNRIVNFNDKQTYNFFGYILKDSNLLTPEEVKDINKRFTNASEKGQSKIELLCIILSDNKWNYCYNTEMIKTAFKEISNEKNEVISLNQLSLEIGEEYVYRKMVRYNRHLDNIGVCHYISRWSGIPIFHSESIFDEIYSQSYNGKIIYYSIFVDLTISTKESIKKLGKTLYLDIDLQSSDKDRKRK